MKFSLDYKKILVAALVLAVLSVAFIFIIGFGGDTFNNRTMITAYLPYGTSYDEVDTDVLSDEFKELLGKKCEVGFASNFLDGYTNLMVTVSSIIEVDEETILNFLSEKYPDLGIESLNVYKLKADTDSDVLLNILFITLAFVLIFAAYGFIAVQDSGFVLSVEIVTVLSLVITLGLLAVVRVPAGANIIAASVISCSASILCTCWQLGNFMVISKATKSKNTEMNVQKAKVLGLNITVEAAVAAILTLAGISIAAIVTGNSAVAYTAFSLSLPLLVSGALSQLLGINLYSKILVKK